MTIERFNFFIRPQLHGEGLEEFSVSFKNQSSSCEFGEVKDSIAKSIFICGLLPRQNNIRQVLLQEDSYTFEKALEVAKKLNQTEKNFELFQNGQHDHQCWSYDSLVPGILVVKADLRTGRRDYRHGALQSLSTVANAVCRTNTWFT
ncbi:hypothetical protein PR048_001855 [Dryococelus australis]|uniref:Uncharacterized protein n=1 Tax=Dryococelus australis TaxID=614101 RepID=A0ABQ9IJL5_9NEOP|nr:hypothetical protein PR048_001855 [Dryococelus australis]